MAADREPHTRARSRDPLHHALRILRRRNRKKKIRFRARNIVHVEFLHARLRDFCGAHWRFREIVIKLHGDAVLRGPVGANLFPFAPRPVACHPVACPKIAPRHSSGSPSPAVARYHRASLHNWLRRCLQPPRQRKFPALATARPGREWRRIRGNPSTMLLLATANSMLSSAAPFFHTLPLRTRSLKASRGKSLPSVHGAVRRRDLSRESAPSHPCHQKSQSPSLARSSRAPR